MVIGGTHIRRSLLYNALTIVTADTVVFTHAQPSISSTSYDALDGPRQELLEKPRDKADQLRMLLDLNGAVCEVVTGVTVGTNIFLFQYGRY